MLKQGSFVPSSNPLMIRFLDTAAQRLTPLCAAHLFLDTAAQRLTPLCAAHCGRCQPMLDSNSEESPSQHYSGLEEAVFRNITACKELTQSTRTSLGPNGMNKMIINHIDKLFVTNDAATVLRELEVQVLFLSHTTSTTCRAFVNFSTLKPLH
jgi:hypothetical protein